MTELVYVLAGALVALLIARWLGARWRSRRARRRAGRAVAGEHAAIAMLQGAGYRIVDRQARTWWWPLLDGAPLEIEVRADYVVESAQGELLVADVKTGAVAPNLTTAATRRQLLEYRVAFGTTGVLLVCPERGVIHRVDFPAPANGPAPEANRARASCT